MLRTIVFPPEMANPPHDPWPSQGGRRRQTFTAEDDSAIGSLTRSLIELPRLAVRETVLDEAELGVVVVDAPGRGLTTINDKFDRIEERLEAALGAVGALLHADRTHRFKLLKARTP